ncbi:DUF3037 domain-containing protein [Actinokineospora enzanensis]|uniref:DUF3037 domain-containing protein n=1 Tax=Actinokineospora enzanensis TaxID=155975 RepID=UPI0003683741|nr:DUF3037 domain-containing protein [Actinokineospora enzanensis]
MSHVFEYALLRAVPRQDRGEALNVGVLLYCKDLDYLGCRTHVDRGRLLALDPALDLDVLADTLAVLDGACAGGDGRAPVSAIPIGQRFRWLTAPRSTLVQTSPTHPGLTADPGADLDRLFRALVLPPDQPG